MDDLRKNDPVLTGIIIEGEPVSGIQFFELIDFSGGIGAVPSDAEVRIEDEDQNSCLMEYQGSSVFACAGGEIIPEAGTQYSLIAIAGDENLVAKVILPDAFDLLSLSNTTYTIDASEPTAIAFQFSWEDDPRYSYVLTLESLDPDAELTPFFPSDAFEQQYGLPVLEGQANFRADYFNQVGMHRVTIYAIDKVYESVFFFDPESDIRSFLNAGPDNVEGGKGFVTGVSVQKFNIEIFQ